MKLGDSFGLPIYDFLLVGFLIIAIHFSYTASTICYSGFNFSALSYHLAQIWVPHTHPYPGNRGRVYQYPVTIPGKFTYRRQFSTGLDVDIPARCPDFVYREEIWHLRPGHRRSPVQALTAYDVAQGGDSYFALSYNTQYLSTMK